MNSDPLTCDLLLITAQYEHELSGFEDPSILHAYIAYLPSKLAYREGEPTVHKQYCLVCKLLTSLMILI